MPEDRLSRALMRKRDEFRKAEPVYKFFEEAYKGGDDYINADHLYIHTFEDGEGFQERKKRAYYYNYCAPIVNAYNSFIYRQKITRDFGKLDENTLFGMFKDNADRRCNGYDEFIRNLSKWASVSGIRYVLVDKPEESADTHKEEIEQELFPYLVHVDPLNVWDWGLDRWGNLIWVKIREVSDSSDDFQKDPDETERFRIWYKDRWELYEVERGSKDKLKAFKVGDGLHPIGEVPLVPVYHFSEEPMTGFSLQNDIAYVNRSLYNWCSLLDEILYRQTFSQLVMPEDPKNPINEKAFGTARGLGFPPESKHAPHFISPDASQARVLMDQIEKGVEEIYRMATLRGAIGVTEQSSGVARSYDFMITNNTLSNKALNMEDAEMKILEFWAKWQGIEAPSHTIEYPREFDITTIAEEIETIIKAQTLDMSERLDQIMKEGLAQRLAPRASDDDKKLILEQIKANSRDSFQVRDANGNPISTADAVRRTAEDIVGTT